MTGEEAEAAAEACRRAEAAGQDHPVAGSRVDGRGQRWLSCHCGRRSWISGGGCRP